MRPALTAMLLLGLAACAAGPGRGADKPAAIGSAARAKHGAEPLAAPPPGVGEAEDPPGATPR